MSQSHEIECEARYEGGMECICFWLRRAYRRGYNARARSAATTYAMYGIPERAVEHGAGENP